MRTRCLDGAHCEYMRSSSRQFSRVSSRALESAFSDCFQLPSHPRSPPFSGVCNPIAVKLDSSLPPSSLPLLLRRLRPAPTHPSPLSPIICVCRYGVGNVRGNLPGGRVISRRFCLVVMRIRPHTSRGRSRSLPALVCDTRARSCAWPCIQLSCTQFPLIPLSIS